MLTQYSDLESNWIRAHGPFTKSSIETNFLSGKSKDHHQRALKPGPGKKILEWLSAVSTVQTLLDILLGCNAYRIKEMVRVLDSQYDHKENQCKEWGGSHA